MPPLPTIANVYRTAFIWGDGVGAYAVNVLHFRGTPGSAAGLFTAIDTAVTQGMWGTVSQAIAIQQVNITPLDGSTATVENGPLVGAKWLGGSSGQGIPQGSSILKLRTAKRGKSYRGRVFLPALSEAVQAFGTIDATTATNVTTSWVTFRTAVAAAGYTLVVASYKLATAELVTTAQLEGTSGTQRRRQDRQRS